MLFRPFGFDRARVDYLTTHTSLSPIRCGFAPGFVNYKKWCTRLTAASDKVYQLLAHCLFFRWSSYIQNMTVNNLIVISVNVVMVYWKQSSHLHVQELLIFPAHPSVFYCSIFSVCMPFLVFSWFLLFAIVLTIVLQSRTSAYPFKLSLHINLKIINW
jgi:hypothetical protein